MPNEPATRQAGDGNSPSGSVTINRRSHEVVVASQGQGEAQVRMTALPSHGFATKVGRKSGAISSEARLPDSSDQGSRLMVKRPDMAKPQFGSISRNAPQMQVRSARDTHPVRPPAAASVYSKNVAKTFGITGVPAPQGPLLPRHPFKAAKKHTSAPIMSTVSLPGPAPSTHLINSAPRKMAVTGQGVFPDRPNFVHLGPQLGHNQYSKSGPRTAFKVLLEDRQAGLHRAKQPADDSTWDLTPSRITTRYAGPAGRGRTDGRNEVIAARVDQPSRTRVVIGDDEEDDDMAVPQGMPVKAARKLVSELRTGVKAAKKRTAVDIHESEEGSSGSEDGSDGNKGRAIVRTVFATKGKSVKTPDSYGVPRVRSRSITPRVETALGAADALSYQPRSPLFVDRDICRSSPDAEAADYPDSLLEALDALSLSSGRLQKLSRLPFLRRNLRRAFEARCRQRGVAFPEDAGKNIQADITIEVVYRLQHNAPEAEATGHVAGRSHEEYKVAMRGYECPLCNLHGKFSALYMLKKHLEWDHSEVEIAWELSPDRNQLTLSVPRLDGNDISSDSASWLPSDTEAEEKPVLPLSPSLSSVPDKSEGISSEPSSEPPPSHLKIKLRPKYQASRSHTASSQTQSVASANLGPTAQPPYLPHGNIQFSCRPGGPRLYDLLNTLPMEPFGIMSWFVIDKEEEIFELDDVRDEDKVMMALWGRWILLNRNKFVRDYYRGTIAFVDEYWEMIKLAAGWSALRVWLLMFVVNRFLDGAQVARVLKHYEKLAGVV